MSSFRRMIGSIVLAAFALPAFAESNEISVAQQYGVWAEKSMYGRKYMGIERTTFVIGADGKLKHIFQKVKPNGHAEEVLYFLQQS